MTTLIGTRHTNRIACTDTTHTLTVHNARMDVTVCQCGALWVPGSHTTWHERFLYDHAGKGATLTGFDRYIMAGCDCHPGGQVVAS